MKLTHSMEGPQCPHCLFTLTPDEAVYYETAYTEDECSNCRRKFSVEVFTSTSWTCRPVEASALPSHKGES